MVVSTMSLTMAISISLELAFDTLDLYGNSASNLINVVYTLDNILFNFAVFLHALALQLRTDSSILPQFVIKGRTPVMIVLLITGILNGALGNFFWFKTIGGTIFGICILVLDITYTFYFYKYVKDSKKTLGGNASSTNLTAIIAKNGLRSSLFSLVALVVYFIGCLMSEDTSVMFFVAHFLEAIERSLAICVIFWWINAKLEVDRLQNAAVKKASQLTTIKAPKMENTTAEVDIATLVDSSAAPSEYHRSSGYAEVNSETSSAASNESTSK